ncbi:MAG TPA: ATP-binding cassette domain-containing protein [Virgibacillus sp.]|nr:ATP-binding cassette domain-containing protein [Virgibacillus sp.]
MIEIKDVSKIYTRKDTNTQALKDVNLKINKGDIFGVIGYSGAGKSTLIRVVNYLEKPTSGKILINGTDLNSYHTGQLREARKDIGMIFQHFNLLNSKTIFQNVAIPLVLSKVNKTVIKERVMELLDFVGLADKVDRYPNELSGGQKQRIGIARALASNPSILLCDEATSALDPQTTDSILTLLQRINEEYNITIMIITHEMSIIQKICNKVAVMENGEIIEQGEVLRVFGNPQQKSTQEFVRTIIHDQVPTSVKNSLKIDSESRLFKLSFAQNITNPIMNHLIRTFNLTVNIVYANMNEIQNNTVGYIILQLTGEEAALQDATTYLEMEPIQARELTRL